MRKRELHLRSKMDTSTEEVGRMKSRREHNVAVMLTLFRAVEERDEAAQGRLEVADVEFRWPESLYGGADGLSWRETWLALQPTAAERRMDPQPVAATDEDVVVLWHQRGLSPAGERFDGPVLGLYRLRDGQLARAQMFYFDTGAVADFLSRALGAELRKALTSLRQRSRGERERILLAFEAVRSKVAGEYSRICADARQRGALSAEDQHLLSRLIRAASLG